MKIKLLVALFGCISLVAGCGKSPSPEESAASTQATTKNSEPPLPSATQELIAVPPAPPATVPTVDLADKKEAYELLQDPTELGLNIEADLTLERQAATSDGDVEGKITSFSIGSKQLELETNDIVHDDDKAWVVTKKYGKIRIAGAYGGLCIWLTPSQKAKLKKLLQGN